MADGIYFDGHGLDELSRDLRRAASGMRVEVDKTLAVIGAEITAEAKVIASQHSKTIAATIRMRAIPGAVVISAGDDTTPIAALYEMGNKGSRASDTSFRHPVFGNHEVWVSQPKYAFLRPALAANRRQITKRMEETWDRALAPHRLRPEL